MRPSSGFAYKWYTRPGTTTRAFQYADVPPFKQMMTHGRLMGAANSSPYVQFMSEEAGKNQAYQRGDTPWNGLQELVLNKIAIATMKKQQPVGGASAFNLNQKLTAVQLLAGFKQMLKDDKLNFNFDYFDFLRSCSNFMGTVLSSCDPDGKRGVFAASRVVNLILWEAASTEKPKSTLILQQTMLFRCGDLLASYIKQNGSTYADAVTLRCSGRQVGKDGMAVLTKLVLKAMVGGTPNMGMDPKLFRDLGEKLEAKGVEYSMDPVSNVMMLYVPKAKTGDELLHFICGIWSGEALAKRSKTRRAVLIPFDEPPVYGGTGGEALGRPIVQALASPRNHHWG